MDNKMDNQEPKIIMIKEKVYPQVIQENIDINNELISIYNEQLFLDPNDKKLLKKIKKCKKNIKNTKILYRFAKIILCI